MVSMDNTTAPPQRELSVDMYRVCAAVFVVVGHWLAASVSPGERAWRTAVDAMADMDLPSAAGGGEGNPQGFPARRRA
jgi:hypothetical protein